MSIYEEKIGFFRNVIDDIAKGLNYYNSLNIITLNEFNASFEALEKIIYIINSINYDNIIDELQYINNNISSVIKKYGCYSFEHVINICLSSNFVEKNLTNELNLKYKLLEKYVHPLNYVIINWNGKSLKNTKEISKLKILDDKHILESNTLECFDLARCNTNFIIKVYGIKIIIHDHTNHKSLVINALCDDDLMPINISNGFLINKNLSIEKFIQTSGAINNDAFIPNIWNNFLNNFSLKELLIYNEQELYNKYTISIGQTNLYFQKTLETIVQDFISFDLYNQRAIIIQLLLTTNKADNLCIAYLLYDLLSNDKINGSDNSEQRKIYNSLNWNCKKHLKNALQRTVEYTNELLNYETTKIPLEQHIYLMNVSINVKEKALQKLKEVKSKSDDSGSKAKQFLDGLLKIPFNIYKEEEILKIKYDINFLIKNIQNPIKNESFLLSNTTRDISCVFKDIDSMKNNNNNVFNINIIEKIKHNKQMITDELLLLVIEYIENNKRKITTKLLKSFKNIMVDKKIYYDKNVLIKENLLQLFKSLLYNTSNKDNSNNMLFINEIILFFKQVINTDYYNYLLSIEKNINQITKKNSEIVAYMEGFNNILDKAVYGHSNAKLQIERIVGQWINGESTGYCFGFEGLPGIGKTSLAQKGLANCLKDANNNPRPFSLIALGGSANGSVLEGHNYTYVGSTWGKIVDILMEHKCMNPIIFIDELDKVSKTEHGKEIIGILIHLIDSTQNTHFQDKYFSNIDLDLSKVLFIFSYNDVDMIDKILLDRIHRIKFDILTLDDKIIIARDYLLPELYVNFHFNDVLIFDDIEIKFIIEHYTNEPGVRKLKELLFEIISSINLTILKGKFIYELPYTVSIAYIEELLKDRYKISYLKINSEPKVGIINGLWANSFGNSGIIHIESGFFYSSKFLELKLTGMQGDIMKESMEVAKTLAFSLLTNEESIAITKKAEESKMQGIHIHVPEGATPKDGPSAGTAITLVIYSLLTNRKIKNNIAITGEICLQGKITAIGGLDLKLIGGLRAGATTFYYPKANAKDYKLFCEKYENKLEGCIFIELENIEHAIKEIILD